MTSASIYAHVGSILYDFPRQIESVRVILVALTETAYISRRNFVIESTWLVNLAKAGFSLWAAPKSDARISIVDRSSLPYNPGDRRRFP